jgi:hypothetical protein
MGILVPRPVDSAVSQHNSRRVTTPGDPPRGTRARLALKFLDWLGKPVVGEDLSARCACDVLYELRRKFDPS